MRRIVATLLVLLLLGAGISAWMIQSYLHSAAGGTQTAIVVVKRGGTLRPVLDELAAQGVLEHPSWLYLYARLQHQTAIRTGRYEIHADQPPVTILAMLLEGRVMLEAFTIAEGLNRWQVRTLLAEGQWMEPAQFDQLCDSAQFLTENHIPGPTCEGYLFPETYKFARGVPPAAVFQTMFAAFKRAMAAVATTAGRGPMALSERQFTTLASIVEKETGRPDERPHIACIFYNRLQAKPPWKMETDPTVIYAATLADPHFNGNITRAHLRTLDNPYNTYRFFGLPPGPIASPGKASLEAVGHPMACKDFFFVSNNAGEHIFCPTLDCHNKAVKKWQVDYFHHKPPAAHGK